MIKIAVAGAAGKMGRRVIACAAADPEVKVVGALEAKGHPMLGADAGAAAGMAALGVRLTDDTAAALEGAEVVLDFTHHTAVAETAMRAAEAGKAMVIGTTGLTAAERGVVAEAAKRVAVVLAPNMSVGVNVLFRAVASVAATLGTGYDAEIIEAHHNQKKDAPSGTATRLAEIVAEALGRDFQKDTVYGRRGMIGARKPTEIGVHAVRAGDIVGEHTVVFAGPGERLELTHRAHSRDTFARGALRAAKFVATKPPRLYSMRDVLGG